ncbi:MAG: DEAD/DEAH box helicase [Candidatus Nitrotoga sp.]
MSFSTAEIESSIEEAIAPGFREKLLARGQARAMIWRDGVLPEDAPPFSNMLSHDLVSYGYSLMSHGLRLVERQGNEEIARRAFEHAGEALEAVVSKGVDNPERDFHRLVAATAYHLGHFSARAYSMIHLGIEQANWSKSELTIARLMLRNFEALDSEIARWRQDGVASDEALITIAGSVASEDLATSDASNEAPDSALMKMLDLALTDGFLGAIATAMLAFERGNVSLLEDALQRLRIGQDGAAEFGLVTQWWSHKLANHLLSGLWDMSFHVRLPVNGAPNGTSAAWLNLRGIFIATLYCRKKSEIELWPSQLEAAKKVLEVESNLVLSLPTSAGKTRIAELCILACLATGKRVVFVTPLRALSAQTELVLQRTFLPLGKTVSSLYGSIGASGADVDALRARDIIVATPEKLDFAMRSDPTLLDDVGLVVLDEGHMIGLSEREVRYEAQIQRLLRRTDAANRRIVCLSAILPEGDQLHDFVAWLTADKPEGLIKMDWRPTRLRFGEVLWNKDHGRLNVSVGEEKPFVPIFFKAIVPSKKGRKEAFPRDQRELCLATAWRLVEDGQSVLIFCPERRSVEPYAKAIVDLHQRGVLESVLSADEKLLSAALAIGVEWLGQDHVLLKCLMLGVAVHHAALPSPYRREVERLLQSGVLKVTISSPTLAQGLNLSATSLVFHGLIRNRELIDISEFRNVIGRAGRAYVDIEGLVLFPIYKDRAKNEWQWKKLIEDQRGRQMESGLFRLIASLLIRMSTKLGTQDLSILLEYVAGNNAWAFPQVAVESTEVAAVEEAKWQSYMTSLDTALLSLLGDQAVADNDVERCLDVALASSLFERRLRNFDEPTGQLLSATMSARAKFIWENSTAAQRRGYFLAGVGLETGLILDARADELELLLVSANAYLLVENENAAVDALTAFAEIIFAIPPFVPRVQPGNWKDVLAVWLSGEPIASVHGGATDDVLRFVEEALIYKLPWGMEAVRVRGLVHANPFSDDGTTLSDYELGLAVAAIETGTTVRSAAYLMQSGFGSRLAAIKAVRDGAGVFSKASDLVLWLRSAPIVALTANEVWPTKETHSLWVDFLRAFDAPLGRTWKRSTGTVNVSWFNSKVPPPEMALRIGAVHGTEDIVYSADYEPLGKLALPFLPGRKGLLVATVTKVPNTIKLDYVGPSE